MQACQFCGAKSWGPAKDLSRLTVNNRSLEEYRECDACGSFGLASVVLFGVGDSAGAFPGPRPFGVVSPLPFDPIESATGLLKGMGIGPKPHQTRTYELVRDLLQANPREGSSQSSEDYAKWLVFMALLIEDELDRSDKLDEEAALSVDLSFEMKPRNFQLDFLYPVTIGFGFAKHQQERIALALDCAIAFGALEAQTGNESLKLSPALEQAYWEKVSRLKASVS